MHRSLSLFVTEDIIRRNIEALEKDRACVTAVPSKDTVKIADENGYVATTPNRELVWNMQTPQSFDFSLIYDAYRKLIREEANVLEKGIKITDDAMVAELFENVKIKLVEGSYENIKITTPDDLPVAMQILQNRL